MNPRNVEKLRDYLSLITKKRGGIGSTLGDISIREIPAEGGSSPLESFSEPGETLLSAARTGIEALERGRELSTNQFISVEAIIDADLRPAIDVVDGKFKVTHPLWTHLSSDAAVRARIETVLPSIGRIELPGHRRLPYGGTGFVVGDGLVMTNRHVAEIFASGLGDRRIGFLPNGRAGIDFVREYERPPGLTLIVRRVMMIHPFWDMALLAVDGLPAERKPLKLSLVDARDLVGREIFVVGYPAFDPRNPAAVQNNLFNGRFGVKRLQPGELQGGIKTASFGKIVAAASHDCSTLGGNSGSAVLDMASGDVLALHFGGAYHERNYAVPASALASDSRVVDAGVNFAGPPPGGFNDWADWWKRADSGESAKPSVPANDTGSSAAGPSAPSASALHPSLVTQVSTGVLSLQVPLYITVSLGALPTGAAVGLSAEVSGNANVTETMREPQHDTSYTARKGYSASFLDAGAQFEVPLPTAKNPSIVAPTRSGGKVLHYQNFSIVMHATRRLALFTASNVTKEPQLRRPDPNEDYTRKGLSGLGKNDTERWFIDSRIEERYQLPDAFFTKDRKAFDKGHIVRRDDVTWGKTYDAVKRANGDTYHVTNCSPQVAGFNQSSQGEDNWGDLENHVLASAATERLCVFAGPVLAASDEVFIGAGDAGKTLRAKIPSRFWKIIIARVDDEIGAFGFVLEQNLSNVQWEEFVVPEEFAPVMYRITDIEQMTGVSFGSAVCDADQYDSVRGAELVFRGVPRSAAA